MLQITEAHARKVLDAVDAGLVKGLGRPELGQMCVEAAVCYALGLPHDDDPKCVAPALRTLKIRLNDSEWSSNQARGAGLRRLAVAQLGSAGLLDEKEFVRRLCDHAIRVSAPNALRAAASVQKNRLHKAALLSAANKCEVEGTRKSAQEARSAYVIGAAAAAYASASAAAYAPASGGASADAVAAAAYAAHTASYAYGAYAAAAGDLSLADYAEAVVQILIVMNAPGCQWLALTEAS